MVTPPRPSRRSLAIFCIAWLLLTAAGAGLHLAAWSRPPVGVIGVADPVARSIANLFFVAAAPGWATLRLSERHGLFSTSGAVVASAVSWALWLGALASVLALRRRLVGRGGAEAAATDLSRRRFLVDAPCAAAGALGAAGMARATSFDPWRIAIARCTVPVAGLPAAFDGLRIVQISDTHLGPFIPASLVRRAVEMALELKPDLFALTGDYILTSTRNITPAAELFAPLARPGGAPFGVVGVLGNHDWYGDGHAMRSALERVGVIMIDNDRVFLDGAARAIVSDQPAGDALCVAGFGDLHEHRVDTAAAFRGVGAGVPRIVLSHNPDSAEIADVALPRAGRAPERIDLMLSGHTHGGQVRLPLVGSPIVPSDFGQKYAGGLAQGPICPVVVSRGVGMSILPVRFGVPPEIVEVTLRVAGR